MFNWRDLYADLSFTYFFYTDGDPVDIISVIALLLTLLIASLVFGDLSFFSLHK